MAKKQSSKDEKVTAADEATNFGDAGEPSPELLASYEQELLPEEDCGCGKSGTEEFTSTDQIRPPLMDSGDTASSLDGSSEVAVDSGAPPSWLIAEIEGLDSETTSPIPPAAENDAKQGGPAPDWIADEIDSMLMEEIPTSESSDIEPDEVVALEGGAPSEWLVQEIEGADLESE